MVQCSACGGAIQWSIPDRKFKCLSCNTMYEQKDVKELDEYQVEQVSMNQFVCPTCGGEVYSRDNAASNFCSFCGSSNPLTVRMVNWRKPNKIMPFRVTKEQAMQNMRNRMKGIFIASEVRAIHNPDSWRAIYVPYWCYTSEAQVQYGVGSTVTYSQTNGNRVTETNYRLDAQLLMDMYGLTYDASQSFPDDLTEGLGGFMLNTGMEEFDTAYFNGYYADLADVAPNTYEQAVNADSIELAKKELEDRIKGEHSGQGTPHIKGITQDNAKVAGCELVMVPVWFISFRKGSRVVYGVVNGVTGKVSCDLPLSMSKIGVGIGVLSVPIFFMANMMNFTIETLVQLILFLFIGVLFMFFKTKKALKAKETGDVAKLKGSKNAVGIGISIVFLSVWLYLFVGKAVLDSILSAIAIKHDEPVYFFAFAVGAFGAGVLVNMISKFNKLSTRCLPHFKYQGGNTKNA